MKPDRIITYGEIIDVEPFNGEWYTLGELHHIVGGSIEIIKLKDNEVMIINAPLQFTSYPHNDIATKIYRENYLDSITYIKGNVLICNKERIK